MITGIRRSALYVPCDNVAMIRKSAEVPADVLLLNLEDGVADFRKDAARMNTVTALKSLDFGQREVVVRVNSPESDAGRKDLAAIIPCRPDGICLPKVEIPEAVAGADAAMRTLELASGIPEGSIRLHAMIESAAGVLGAREVAAAAPRMTSLIFGSADYCEDVRCTPAEDRIEMLLALQMIVAAARAAGIDAIDAPCFDIRNQDLLRRETAQARRFGFDGKSALHPGQLPWINELMDVTREEIEWAGRVLAELRGAGERGRALSTLDGQLIDNPHRSAAERILRRARASRPQEGL